MNRDFKLKFNEMRDNDPGNNDAEQNRSFSNPGHVRNICFIWPDGKKKFRNYAYMIGNDFDPAAGCITIIFTSDTFIIKGIRLNELFEELFYHIPKRIICTDERYNSIQSDAGPIVNDILILETK